MAYFGDVKVNTVDTSFFRSFWIHVLCNITEKQLSGFSCNFKDISDKTHGIIGLAGCFMFE